MTMTALANEVNTSRSLISQIESGYTYPSLQTLEKIVKALGMSLSDFFKDDISETDANDFVVKADNRQTLDIPDTKNTYYLLSKTVYQNIEFLLTDYPPHSDIDSSDPFAHDGIEYFWVVDGQIHLTVEGKTTVLNKGDSGCFNSRLKHCYANKSDSNAQIVLFSIKE